jgi:hypothetical protein
LLFCLFRFSRNTETLCFGIEAKQLKQTFGSDGAETSFGSSFGCFESKLVLKNTLPTTNDQRGHHIMQMYCTPQLKNTQLEQLNFNVSSSIDALPKMQYTVFFISKMEDT